MKASQIEWAYDPDDWMGVVYLGKDASKPSKEPEVHNVHVEEEQGLFLKCYK